MAVLSTLLCLALFVLYATAAPTSSSQTNFHGLQLVIDHDDDAMKPSLPVDFPDPSVVQDYNGTWYAFATNSGGVNVQVAQSADSDPFSEWSRLDIDAMPDKSWTSGRNTWAPDVRALPDDSFIMYFSGELPDTHQHCVGVARSDSITGPYKPDPQPWVCPRDKGGAIDASGFFDEDTGRRYVVYKIDGNSKPGFSPCGTGVNDPSLRTPLMLQEVSVLDGATKKGNPVELLDRIASEDGALIEAPELQRLGDGTYVLFYSSHCFNDPRYNIKYAWSTSVTGPYRRAAKPLLQTSDFTLRGPGGVTTGRTDDGDDFIGFHGYCEDNGRCLYIAEWKEA